MIARTIGIASLLGVLTFAGPALAQADLDDFKTKAGVEMLEAAAVQKLHSGNTFVGTLCVPRNRCREANVAFEMYMYVDGSGAGRIGDIERRYNKARVGPAWWMDEGKFCTQFTTLLGGCKWEFYRLGEEIRMYNPATGKLHAAYTVETGDTRGLK